MRNNDYTHFNNRGPWGSESHCPTVTEQAAERNGDYVCLTFISQLPLLHWLGAGASPPETWSVEGDRSWQGGSGDSERVLGKRINGTKSQILQRSMSTDTLPSGPSRKCVHSLEFALSSVIRWKEKEDSSSQKLWWEKNKPSSLPWSLIFNQAYRCHSMWLSLGGI